MGGGTALVGGGTAAVGGRTAVVGGGTAVVGGGTAVVGGGTAAVGGGTAAFAVRSKLTREADNGCSFLLTDGNPVAMEIRQIYFNDWPVCGFTGDQMEFLVCDEMTDRHT